MLGGILKLTLFLNVFFLFIILLWQVSNADASPILAINDNLAESSDDQSILSTNRIYQRGAPIVKRSLHLPIDQQTLIDGSHVRSRSRHRRLRKKVHSNKLKTSPNIFQSTDDRLKRFRMLDPDEFQEMLKALSHQIPNEHNKDLNTMDTIGGMQLENYWSRK